MRISIPKHAMHKKVMALHSNQSHGQDPLDASPMASREPPTPSCFENDVDEGKETWYIKGRSGFVIIVSIVLL